jgi:hypothetical protein
MRAVGLWLISSVNSVVCRAFPTLQTNWPGTFFRLSGSWFPLPVVLAVERLSTLGESILYRSSRNGVGVAPLIWSLEKLHGTGKEN